MREPFATLSSTRNVLNGRDSQTPLELLHYIIYEPELSERLINDLQDIFSTSNRGKYAKIKV
jgi:hypothetical protein